MGRQANLSGAVINFDRAVGRTLSQVVERVGVGRICSVGHSVRAATPPTCAGGRARSISPDMSSTRRCAAACHTRRARGSRRRSHRAAAGGDVRTADTEVRAELCGPGSAQCSVGVAPGPVHPYVPVLHSWETSPRARPRLSGTRMCPSPVQTPG